MIGMDRHTGQLIDDASHLRQSVADILFTPLGTRIGRRDYGSNLPQLLDQPLNAMTRIRIFAATALALQRHESRLRISRIALEAGADAGTARLVVSGRRTDRVGAPPLFDISLTLAARGILV